MRLDEGTWRQTLIDDLSPATRRWLESLTATWLASGLPLACLLIGYMAVLSNSYARDHLAVRIQVWSAPRRWDHS
jgi:hypothetical protein